MFVAVDADLVSQSSAVAETQVVLIAVFAYSFQDIAVELEGSLTLLMNEIVGLFVLVNASIIV